MGKIAKGTVDVAATLTKWGFKGTGYVLNCGIDLADAIMKDVGNLAAAFSGTSVKTNVGGFLAKEFNKGAHGLVNGAVKGSVKVVDILAEKAKSYL